MQKEKNRLNKRQYIKDLEKLSLFYTTKTREEEGKDNIHTVIESMSGTIIFKCVAVY